MIRFLNGVLLVLLWFALFPAVFILGEPYCSSMIEDFFTEYKTKLKENGIDY